MTHGRIPIETLMELRQRLDQLPPRSQERRILIEETAKLSCMESPKLPSIGL